ncbi:hypothetical protein NLM33_05555 [Bradyrhizobium sp. CCGUVB1N3]|uniref:hypothetical protein n=1 Tax=Bradyrhizobium sp. CCGUVB1N3 TaxID=2949629 RepID=UPI0020B38A96|nr:hypothetical protein [Bradyrhizobium sp. CCGUVB1N3]MCP3469794.1 hypothetical protein [Bradyrhizobium sp. CCGUVB1N3]
MKSVDQEIGCTHAGHPAEIHGIGSWITLVVLFALLVATMVLAYVGSNLAVGIDIPMSGYMAFCLGAFFSLLAGAGLTALVFYSSPLTAKA